MLAYTEKDDNNINSRKMFTLLVSWATYAIRNPTTQHKIFDSFGHEFSFAANSNILIF